jgi:hypothetical protein
MKPSRRLWLTLMCLKKAFLESGCCLENVVRLISYDTIFNVRSIFDITTCSGKNLSNKRSNASQVHLKCISSAFRSLYLGNEKIEREWFGF